MHKIYAPSSHKFKSIGTPKINRYTYYKQTMPTSTDVAVDADPNKRKTSGTLQRSLQEEEELPPCPSRPHEDDKPTGFHPDWQLHVLKKPEPVKDADGNWVWVFYSFVHKTNYTRRWFPPPPPTDQFCSDCSDNNEEEPEVIDVDKPKSGTLTVVGRPPLDQYAKEMLGEEEDELVVEEEVPKEPVELTIEQLTFTADKPVKLLMNPKPHQVDLQGKPASLPNKCKELGIDIADPVTGKKYVRNDLSQLLNSYMLNVLHKGDEIAFARCFSGAKQDIGRERKESAGAKRKREVEAKANGTKKAKKKKKVKPIGTAVSLYVYMLCIPSFAMLSYHYHISYYTRVTRLD